MGTLLAFIRNMGDPLALNMGEHWHLRGYFLGFEQRLN
jgi:hypothetical protein